MLPTRDQHVQPHERALPRPRVVAVGDERPVGAGPRRLDQLPHVLTAADLAPLFRVDPKTVSRWGRDGRIPSFRTPGGHRRFRREDIAAFLEAYG